MTYVIWLFCRVATNDYLIRAVSLVLTIFTLFYGINSLRGCSKIKKAMNRVKSRSEQRCHMSDWRGLTNPKKNPKKKKRVDMTT